MADMKIDLMGSMKMLLGLVGVYGVYKLITIVMTLIFGSSANVALSGDINVTNQTTSTLESTDASYNAGIELFNSGDTIVLSLIGLVVILKLFWPLISSYMDNSGGSKKRGSGKGGFK